MCQYDEELVINLPAVTKCCYINASSEIAVLWLPAPAQSPANRDLSRLERPVLVPGTSYSWLWDPAALLEGLVTWCQPHGSVLLAGSSHSSTQGSALSDSEGWAASPALPWRRLRHRATAAGVRRHKGPDPAVLPCLQRHQHLGDSMGIQARLGKAGGRLGRREE